MKQTRLISHALWEKFWVKIDRASAYTVKHTKQWSTGHENQCQNNTVEFDVLMYLSIMIKLFVCLKLFIVLLKSLSILLNNHLNGDVNITSEVLQIKILMLSANKYNQWCLSFYVKNFILTAWQWWWYWHVFGFFFF